MVLEPLTGRNTTRRDRLSRPRERFEGHLGPAFRLPAVTVHELDSGGHPARRQPAFVGIHERPEPPGGGKPGRTVRKGVAGPETPQVAKKGGNVGPGDADSLCIHDHIRESRLDHRVADVMHINKINNMRTVVDPFPASPKLREGAWAKRRERDEPPGTKHSPDLPEDRPGIGKPEKAEIGSHQVGGFGGEGKREGTRRDGLDRAGGTRFGRTRKVPAGKNPRSGETLGQTARESALHREVDHPARFQAHRVEMVEQPFPRLRAQPFGGGGVPATTGEARPGESGTAAEFGEARLALVHGMTRPRTR